MHADPDAPLERLLAELAALAGDPAAAVDPLERETLAFLRATWEQAAGGLLQRTARIRVQPWPVPGGFSFELDLPYKRRVGAGPITLEPGPIRGAIRYARNLYAPRGDAPSVAVHVDPEHGMLHPNVHPELGACCLGPLPTPYPLDALLEHLYRVLSYQSCNVTDPLNPDASAYFRLDPAARAGLEPVPPLWEGPVGGPGADPVGGAVAEARG